MPIQFWRTTLVVYAPKAWQFNALRLAMPIRTQCIALTDEPLDWSDAIKDHFEDRFATSVHLADNVEHLEQIVLAAQGAKSRITLCAWDAKRKFVHIHAPFKTSPFPDRDVHYMRRYFGYFLQQAD